MNKILDNDIVRDMTPEEQAQFDTDQASPTPIVEGDVSAEELLARLEALLK